FQHGVLGLHFPGQEGGGRLELFPFLPRLAHLRVEFFQAPEVEPLGARVVSVPVQPEQDQPREGAREAREQEREPDHDMLLRRGPSLPRDRAGPSIKRSGLPGVERTPPGPRAALPPACGKPASPQGAAWFLKEGKGILNSPRAARTFSRSQT